MNRWNRSAFALLCLLPAGLFAQGQPTDSEIQNRIKTIEDSFTESRSKALLHQRIWTVFYGGSMLVNGARAAGTKSPEPDFTSTELFIAQSAGVHPDLVLYQAGKDSYSLPITALEQGVLLSARGPAGIFAAEEARKNHKVYLENQRDKESSIVSTITSGLGLLAVRLRPHPSMVPAPELDKMPSGTPEEKRAKLKVLEQYFADQAAAADRAVGVRAHVAVIGVAAIAGFAVHSGYKQPAKYGWIQFGLTLLSGELRILTTPGSLQRDYEKYRSQSPGAFHPGRPDSDSGVRFEAVVAVPGGVAAVFSF